MAQRSSKNTKTKKSKQRRRTKKRAKSLSSKRILLATAVLGDPALPNLNKIKHIVILMLENRSFDHMLGYQKLRGRPVNGLTPEMNNTYNGANYLVSHLSDTQFELDPCHSSNCVARQIGNNNGGFILDYARAQPTATKPEEILGYYDETDLPVYDFLSREFCVCDQWYSSVPGPTWPNRLYALTGSSGGNTDNKTVPLYNRKSFVRHLDAANVSWRWYCHDISTLRLVDGNYRIGHDSNFFYFDNRTIFDPVCFIDHARSGDLASVSWIDPNFVDFGTSKTYANDDHPPADVKAGQALALKLYNALIASPVWDQTLLVITYDEHGGFFDHVMPESAPGDTNFNTFGCRVPTIIVSPWVARGAISSQTFDHTSIIKTILLRFCRTSDGTIPDMGKRIEAAMHLGSVLTETTARPPAVGQELTDLIKRVSDWRAEVESKRLMIQPAPTRARRAVRNSDVEARINDFQRGLLNARRRLARSGLPEGRP